MNLIDKQHPAVAGLDKPGNRLIGTGKGALRVTE